MIISNFTIVKNVWIWKSASIRVFFQILKKILECSPIVKMAYPLKKMFFFDFENKDKINVLEISLRLKRLKIFKLLNFLNLKSFKLIYFSLLRIHHFLKLKMDRKNQTKLFPLVLIKGDYFKHKIFRFG